MAKKFHFRSDLSRKRGVNNNIDVGATLRTAIIKRRMLKIGIMVCLVNMKTIMMSSWSILLSSAALKITLLVTMMTIIRTRSILQLQSPDAQELQNLFLRCGIANFCIIKRNNSKMTTVLLAPLVDPSSKIIKTKEVYHHRHLSGDHIMIINPSMETAIERQAVQE